MHPSPEMFGDAEEVYRMSARRYATHILEEIHAVTIVTA
jgi:hypothetical protein